MYSSAITDLENYYACRTQSSITEKQHRSCMQHIAPSLERARIEFLERQTAAQNTEAIRSQEQHATNMQAALTMVQQYQDVLTARDTEVARLQEALEAAQQQNVQPQPQRSAPRTAPPTSTALRALKLAQRTHSLNAIIKTCTDKNILRDTVGTLAKFVGQNYRLLPGAMTLLNLVTPLPTHGLTESDPAFWIGTHIANGVCEILK